MREHRPSLDEIFAMLVERELGAKSTQADRESHREEAPAERR
jgi:hypothetical protein